VRISADVNEVEPVSTRSPRRWHSVAIFLACVLSCHAQRYSFKHYLQDSGLTNLAVNTINQDKDGFLWVATDNGLFRYNGRRFQRFGTENGLPQDDVAALAVSAGGTLWASTPVGVAYWSGDRFHTIQPGPDLDQWAPRRLAGGLENAAYASSGHGLVKFALERNGASVKRLYAGETYAVAVDAKGVVWFGCGRELCRIDGQTVMKVGAQLGLPSDQWDSAAIDQQGSVWIRSEAHLYQLPANGSTFLARDRGLPLSPGTVSELKADPIYGVTVPTRTGFAIPFKEHAGNGGLPAQGDNWRIIGERNGLNLDDVATAFRDREGSMWIGLRGSGVDRWVGEGKWESWTRAEGLPADTLWGIAKDAAGRVWAGTNLGINRIDPADGRVRTWGAGGGTVRGNQALAVETDPTGRVWFGGSIGGLASFTPRTSSFQRFGEKDGIALAKVRRILLDSQNTLWVLGATGVYRATDLSKDPVRFTRLTIPGETPDQVYMGGGFDDDGCTWITSNKGLYRYRNGRWNRYGEKDGLKSDSVSAIAVSEGSVWIAYRSPLGITRISEAHDRWSTTEFSTRTGLPSNMIYSLGAKGDSVWAGTDSGVLQFRGGDWKRYGQVDGLAWDDCDTNGIFAEERGVWIGTSRGLSHFEPEPLPAAVRDLRAPYLKYVGQAGAAAEGSELVLPWSSRNFSIAWDNVNYRDEEQVSYQFRINGAESPWTSTADMETRFSNLPAGRYTFEVHALARGARSADALLIFRIAAPWWQTPLFDLGAALAVAALVVSAWRYQSARLLREKQKLETAVALRTRELAQEKSRAEAERERAESASRHKGEFLAHMSHEIRTPMNGIIGMTDLLLGTELDSEQSECAQTVRQCGQHLLSIINDILDYSKIEAGRVELEVAPFDLRTVMALVVDLAGPQVRSKRLTISVEYVEPFQSHFEGDAGRVRQIIMNFVSNAIKFTREGAVRINVKPAAVATGSGREGIRIEVTDSGCGIPADKIGSLFQQFVQADASTTRRYGGTGLGLAISKKLAELMGGSVGVVSEVNQGSTFWVELPLRPAQAPVDTDRPKLRSVAPIDRPLRILVAEDNIVNQKLITRILERLGCRFEVATNGAEAVDLYTHGRYEVVLMDCQMPVCDGYEATAAIRRIEKDRGMARVPIVALTAHAASSDRERCFAAGMDMYLTKPIAIERLQAELSRICADSPSDPQTSAEQQMEELESQERPAP
jgi:signal transduction histidine kinase/CheY-like chemotaxis protein/streptogramin lyase